MLHQIDSKTSDNLFQNFMSSINMFRLKNNRQIDSEKTFINGAALTHQLDQAILDQEWSYLLEKIMTAIGNREQQQQLHYRHLIKCLSNGINFRADWPSETLHLADTASLTVFFEDFLGAHHIANLCQRIDLICTNLLAINATIDAGGINHAALHSFCNMLASLKPLTKLYDIFGIYDAHKKLLKSSNELEKRATLHYELQHTIKQYHPILEITQQNLPLSDLIASVVRTTHKLETANILTDKNINQYLSFLDIEVLARVENSILNTPAALPFDSLAMLANLLASLSSEQIKFLLLQSNLSDAGQNPYWLTLIN